MTQQTVQADKDPAARNHALGWKANKQPRTEGREKEHLDE